MKKYKLLFIIVSSAIAFTGCVGHSNKQITDTNKELVFASTKDIRDINPHLTSGELAAQNLVFESLVINTDEGVKPHLATSWDISEDGLSYTFYLRDNVMFTDGEKLTAEVVKLNIDAVVSNYEMNAWLNLVQEIDTTEAINELTFVLTLKRPYYPTLIELGLTRPFRMISPNDFIDGTTANGTNGFNGTGPYFLSEHKDNQYAIFTRNSNYWGELPKIESINWKVLPNHQSILLGLQNNEIDLVFGADGDMLDANAFSSLQNNGKYTTQVSSPSGSRSVLLNSNREITSNRNVRMALQHAINKQNIVTGVLNDTETVADTLLSKETPYLDYDFPKREYDLNMATDLLEEANWVLGNDGYRYQDGKKLTLLLSYNSDNAQEKTIGELMQHDLKEIGVDLVLLGEEKQAYFDRQKSGDFDLQYSLSWGLPYDPQTYVSTWRVPSHGDYQAQIGLDRKEWLDQLITEVLVEHDNAIRQQKYIDIFTYVYDEAVYLPLTFSVVKVVHSSRLQGVTFNISQYEIPFEKMYFE